MKKRVLSIVLTLCMVLTAQPVSAQEMVQTLTAGDEAGLQTDVLNAISGDGSAEIDISTPLAVPAAQQPLSLGEEAVLQTAVPTAAAQTQTANDEAGLKNAVASAVSGGTVTMGGNFSITSTIIISKNVTLDLAGRTLTSNVSNGSICLQFTAGGAIVDSVGGGTLTGSAAGSALVHNAGGSLEISGGKLIISGSQSRAFHNDGTLRITGGEVNSASGYAILNNGTVAVSGGQVVTDTGVGVINYAAGSSLTVSGGVLKSTSVATESTYAAYNNIAGATITVNGGTINAGKGSAVGNFNGGIITVNGGLLSADNGMAVFNYGDSVAAIHGGTVTSVSGYGVLNYGNLVIDGGTVSSNSSVALTSFAKGGMDIRLSGGIISAKEAAAVYNNGSGEIQLLGSTVSTTAASYPAVVNASTGTISVTDGTITAVGSRPTFYNVSSGTLAVKGGTFSGIYNARTEGAVKIDGGSVKLVQGATAKNSLGVALQPYIIKLTHNGAPIANTPVSGSELTFTPADKAAGYGFTGVQTDADGRLYLWLPGGIKSALYKSQAVEITGAVSSGTESLLPNFNVSVTVYLNDQIWPDCPLEHEPMLVPEGSTIGRSVMPKSKSGGVFTYSGLDKDKLYEVWGRTHNGFGFSGVKVSKTSPSVEVHYYTLTVNNAGGISYIYPKSGTNILKGTNVVLGAFTQSGLTFEKWTDGEGNTVSTVSEFSIGKLDGPRTYTAKAKVAPFDAGVTVRKDGTTWSAFDGEVVLSPSADNANTVISGTAAKGVYTFPGLSQTYYVWAKLSGGQLVYTGQKVTFGATAAAVDYYTIILNKGSNINQVTGAGTYLKGSPVPISAEVSPESGGLNYMFSRWAEGGALLSTMNPYTIPAISRSYDLTAEGRVGAFAATVTLNKDGARWTSSPRSIHLTQQGSDAPITGVVSNGGYTFTGLDSSKIYEIWDDETVRKTGVTLDASNRDRTLNYFTVTASKGSGVTSVTGGGVYLGGSTVTVAAAPEAYYTVTWQAIGTVGTADGVAYTVSNLSAATSLNATGDLVNFTGTVTLKKDDALWSGQTVSLSTAPAIPGNIAPTQSLNGSYMFNPLDPHNTYSIFVNGKATGKTLSHTAVNATLDYYTVEVALENVTSEAKVGTVGDSGPYPKGTAVGLTAALANPNHDFVGWFSGSTLLTTEKELTVSGIAAKQTLSAKANSTFAVTVTVSGKADISTIKLSDSSAALTNALSGTAAGSTLTFENLNRGTTYYIFDGSAYTGKSVSKTVTAAALQFYTITVTPGSGISTATANTAATATVLEGATVTLNAVEANGYGFSRWVDAGGNTVAQTNPATVIAGKNMTLTAVSTAIYTGGDIDINTGSVVISDSATAGKLKIVQGATTWESIDPSQNITVKGGGTQTSNNITISAKLAGAAPGSAVRLTLKDVNIKRYGPGLEIASDAGDIELTTSGNNSLESTQTYNAGLQKTGAQKLTIRSIDGTANHRLTALGNANCSSGIGFYNATVANITIDSGIVVAAGNCSGIGSYGTSTASTENIVINGGTFGDGYCLVGTVNQAAAKLKSVTVNGGTARLSLKSQDSTSANVRINGGNLLLSAGNYGTLKNAAGENVYLTTLTVPGDTAGGLDVSKTLVIKDKNNTLYGMNDVVTFPGGKVYAYLPVGSATIVYNGKTYQINVESNTTVNLLPLNKFNVLASKTVNGVTATATPPVFTGTGYSVTVTLSGTATKPGVINLGLLGSIGNVASQTHTVDSGVVSGVTKTFVFPVPPNDVTDLALAMTFTETSAYTVSYTASNATAGVVPVDTNSYYAGNTYTVAAAGTLQRTGYTFAGWKLGAATHGANSTQTMGTADAVYVATWSPNTYSVIFNGSDATSGAMANQPFTYDANAAALSSNGFTRTGYTFAGWATSANGLKAYTQGEAVRNLTAAGNGTVSLYALWKANTYTVTFVGNGATAGTTENQTIAHGTLTPLNANGFARTGYSFAGWKAGDGTPYANGASIAANGNVTLTAQWTGNPYAAAFKGNGSTAGTMNDMDLLYGTGGTLPPNGFSRTGYSFAGWSTEPDGSGTAYAEKGQAIGMTAVYNDTVKLYAQWTGNPYTVQFNLNNGDSGAMAPQSFTYDAPAKALSGKQFLRSGYTFSGWNSAADGSGVAYGDNEHVQNLTADPSGVVQLYAQWSPGSFSVNFNSGGGIGNMAAQSFQTGDTAPLNTNAFTRSGYTFTGWNTAAGGGGTPYGAQAAVNTLNLGAGDSITLYAQWSPNTYTVKYSANGATGAMAVQNFTYDAQAKELSQNAFTHNGYTFLGWAENPAGASGEYADKQMVRNLTPMQDGVTTLFAVWKANTVDVVFDGNGATAGSMEKQSFAHNTEQPLSPNTYQRAGYTFAGWNVMSSGRGVSYSDGQAVTDPTPDITGNMTLYAQWQLQSRYGLSGYVTNDNTPAIPIPDASVTLKQGSVVHGVTKTDANGRYSFANLLPGIYNVVCADDGKTVTKAMTVNDSPVTVNFIISGTAKNSLLELVKEGSVSIPALVVDGLYAVADEQAQPNQVTTVKLTVTAKTPDNQNGEQAAIRALTNSQTVETYLDAQLTSNGASIGSSNNKVLEILIPYDFSSKTDIQVLRYHDGTADALTKLSSRPTSDFKDGTWFGDVNAGRIFVYASKFSTYAISYSAVSSGGGAGGGSSGGSGGGSGGSFGYPVTIDKSTTVHGTLTADRTTAPAGAEITITVRPDNGYQLHRLTITDAEGKAIRYTDKGNGTYTFTMPTGKVAVSAAFTAKGLPEPPKAKFPFVDVSTSYWAYADITWAYDKGIFNGTGDGTTFSPGLSTTRGMIATLLWRTEGKPSATGDRPFDDVQLASYYEQAIHWAAGKKIVEGYGNRLFGPDDTITREQMAAILYRYATYKGYDVSKNEDLHGFSDGSRTSGYAVKAMGWAVGNRFIGGKGDGILDPTAGATRAEVAAILKRFNGVFKGN